MTSKPSSALPASSAALQPHLRAAMAAERTRLLYQGSRIPTFFMLLCGMTCTYLLWGPTAGPALAGWLVWLVLLAVLRLIQVAAFNTALPSRQTRRHWYWSFLAGATASGLTLAFPLLVLIPAEAFQQQLLIYGLIAAAMLSAGLAYAVSLPAFLAFAVPCQGPVILWLLTGNEQMRSWGLFTLELALGMLLVTWQVNRLLLAGMRQRFENQALIERLEHARNSAEGLNQALAHEVEQRRRAERSLREAQGELEQRVARRTAELAATTTALAKSEARLALALEASELGLWDWDLESDAVHHSHLGEIFGIDPASVHNVLTDLRPRLHPDDRPLLRQALIEHFKGQGDSYAVEYRVRHAAGHWVWVEDRGRAVERGADGRVLRMLGTRRDVSARRQREEQQRLAATVFEAASEGIVILDPDYRLLAVNRAFSAVTGYAREEVLGRSVAMLIGARGARRQYQQIRQQLERQDSWQGELMETRKSGEPYPQWLQLNVVRDGRGQVSHIVGFFSDLSARRSIEERLHYLSQYDELTGLANRGLFRERLQQAGQRVSQQGRGLALLHVDLDRFKLINDSLGDDLADQLLRQVSRRLTEVLAEADCIARLSADEFAVVLDAYGSLSNLARIASRLLAKLRQPMAAGEHELVISASIGISLLPENARDISALISQANMATQHAKHLGGNSFQFYTDNLQASTLQRLQLENQLRKGIAEGQLEVYYQPKLSLVADALRSAEALVRWHHPQLGLLAPAEFVALAEETGLIAAIGEQVLRSACEQACDWRRQGLELCVSVNVSVHQLRQGNLVSQVRQVLQETGLPAHLLELELTESQLLDNVESVILSFRQLRELGVRLAIDDFGTGYSSLSYLKRFAVDCVKIDQSFIRDLPQSADDAAIVRAIIAMAHSLELAVVAEGVESEAQLAFLRGLGCDEIQGYLVSPPRPAAALRELLEMGRG